MKDPRISSHDFGDRTHAQTLGVDAVQPGGNHRIAYIDNMFTQHIVKLALIRRQAFDQATVRFADAMPMDHSEADFREALRNRDEAEARYNAAASHRAEVVDKAKVELGALNSEVNERLKGIQARIDFEKAGKPKPAAQTPQQQAIVAAQSAKQIMADKLNDADRKVGRFVRLQKSLEAGDTAQALGIARQLKLEGNLEQIRSGVESGL